MRLDARHVGHAILQRLAKRFQHAPGVFRHFIKKQHTVVSQGHFARARIGAAPDKGRG